MAFGSEKGVEPDLENIVGKSNPVQHLENFFASGKRSLLAAPLRAESPAGVEQIIEDGPVKNEGILSDKADVVADIDAGEVAKLPAADQNVSGAVMVQLADNHGQGTLAASGKANQSQLLAGLEGQGDLIEDPDLPIGHEGQRFHVNSAIKQIRLTIFFGQSLELGCHIKRIHDLPITYLAVLITLVIIHQFLPGVVQLFIGR